MTLYALADSSPDVADDAWVAPGSHVIGNIVLEAKTSIWFGATLRGDNERITIGAGSNVQENSVLHTDMGYPFMLARAVRLVTRRCCMAARSSRTHSSGWGRQFLTGP